LRNLFRAKIEAIIPIARGIPIHKLIVLSTHKLFIVKSKGIRQVSVLIILAKPEVFIKKNPNI
jgi:hypothetical protein